MSEKKVTANITIEGAELIFRNFSGKASQYNQKGKCNFGVRLDEELARNLEADGWNVKRLRPREDDPEQYEQPYLNVNVKWDPYPPKIYLVTERGKRSLDEVTSGQLDWSRIKNADVVIRPYNYPAMPGRPAGVSAYLSSMYVELDNGKFYEKYANLPDLDEEEENHGR